MNMCAQGPQQQTTTSTARGVERLEIRLAQEAHLVDLSAVQGNGFHVLLEHLRAHLLPSKRRCHHNGVDAQCVSLWVMLGHGAVGEVLARSQRATNEANNMLPLLGSAHVSHEVRRACDVGTIPPSVLYAHLKNCGAWQRRSSSLALLAASSWG
jgi:hypothetical protein